MLQRHGKSSSPFKLKITAEKRTFDSRAKRRFEDVPNFAFAIVAVVYV